MTSNPAVLAVDSFLGLKILPDLVTYVELYRDFLVILFLKSESTYKPPEVMACQQAKTPSVLNFLALSWWMFSGKFQGQQKPPTFRNLW